MVVIEETHQRGFCSLENLDTVLGLNARGQLLDCDVGLQTEADGRIWLCVNGIAFLRFKPERTTRTAVRVNL